VNARAKTKKNRRIKKPGVIFSAVQDPGRRFPGRKKRIFRGNGKMVEKNSFSA
jgi:hypothetical protein